MKFCFVVKSLDEKFQNIFDAGLSGRNFLFVENQVSTWFIGLRLPEGIPASTHTFNMRPSPYPFPAGNTSICRDFDPKKLRSMLNLLRDYSLRRFEIDETLGKIFFLSNSRGPLTLWSGLIDEVLRDKEPAPLLSLPNL